MVEVAAVLIAVAFVALVGVIIPTVIQLRKTVLQSERVLSQVNSELPGILKELKQTNENVRVMSAQARAGIERASVLMHAIGDVGETVNQVHGVCRAKGESLMKNLVGVLMGLRAVALTLKNRAQKRGGTGNGQEQ